MCINPPEYVAIVFFAVKMLEKLLYCGLCLKVSTFIVYFSELVY